LNAELKLGDEAGRLLALQRLGILDTETEEPFEKIVQLARHVLRMPICAVSLVDHHRQWFKAKCGLAVCQTPREDAFCAYTIKRAAPFVVPDACEDPRFVRNPLVTGEPFVRFYAGVPLRTPDGYNVGSLCVIDTAPRAFTQGDIDILAGFGRLVENELQLRQVAATDHLTGALSRGAWTDRAQAEVSRARRYGRTLSLAMLDIDKFKSINDTYGHPAGDIVIRHIAELCTLALRQSDLFGRFGGEEFVLMMPETPAAEAFAAAERIRTVFANNPSDLGTPVFCTVSIGVSQLLPGETSLAPLVERADRALYQAKQGGRNQTIFSLEGIPQAAL
jgi:diguanylate cyclase (GGDEF)-like protein